MFDHISIGVRDIAKAKAFYDAALKPLGIDLPQRRRDFARLRQRGRGLLDLFADRPVPDDPKSGLHFCFTAPSRDSVEAFHAAALAHGGRDNGKPGVRKDYGPALLRRLRLSTPKAIGSKPITGGNSSMATIRSELKTRAPASDVWSAIRDIGALHTRLVPGFVTDTKLEPGARIVTFVNGVVLREPIVTLDDEARRLVWTARGRPRPPLQRRAPGL